FTESPLFSMAPSNALESRAPNRLRTAAEFRAARGATTTDTGGIRRRSNEAMRRKSAERRREQPVRCSRNERLKGPLVTEEATLPRNSGCTHSSRTRPEKEPRAGTKEDPTRGKRNHRGRVLTRNAVIALRRR